jgi:GNAT superfamily N-acetyltransferase
MTPGPTDVVIRVAGEADIDARAHLRALWTGASAADPEFERRMADWLAADGERRTTWLAAAGGRAVGMASLFEYRRMPKPGRRNERWGYVGNIFVRDEFRNHGVGSALLSAVIAAADQRSYARLVVSPRAEALSLFRRSGFLIPGATTDADALLVRPGPPRPD